MRTDVHGASTVAGLFACGEVAATGVHGANRLASNSLIEGAVFGHRAARSALEDIAERPALPPRARTRLVAAEAGARPDHSLVERLRDSMWEGCGLVRDAAGMRAALAVAEEIAAATSASASLGSVRIHQSATTATVMCRAALLREESRGAHTRSDFPSTRDQWHGVLVMHKEEGTDLTATLDPITDALAPDTLDALIEAALAEDIGAGDVTTDAVIPADMTCRGKIVCKEDGVIAGLSVASRVFAMVDERITFDAKTRDGEKVQEDQIVARISGPARGCSRASALR